MDNSIKDTAAEKALLGAVILNNSFLEELDVTPDDFYHEIHKLIYKAILDLFNAGKTVDFITLQNKLVEEGLLETCGGLQYIMSLSTNAGAISTIVKDHAELVKKKASLRKIYAYASQAANMCQNGCDPDDAMKVLANIELADNTKQQILNIYDVYKTNSYEIEEKSKQDFSGVPTKLSGLDHILGGLQKSDLIILAARPAMGKTALALNIASNVSLFYDKNVLIFSLEMSAGQLVNRIVSSITKLNGSHLNRPNQMTESDWQLYWDAENKIEGKRLDIYDHGNVSPSVVRKIMRQYLSKHDLDLVIIDYLQLMQGDKDYNGNKVLEVGEITRTLKLLAREFDVPIVLLSQLNRSVDSRAEKKPMLADLRDSGTIEQDADIVLFLYREGYYNPDCESPNTTELIVAKHRKGALGTVDLYFDNETTTFYDMLKEC